MPDVLDDQPLVVRRFKLPVGQNDKDEPGSLAGNEVELLQNAIISSRGLRQTRPGNTQIADDLGSAAILGLAHFYPEGGTKLLLMVTGTTFYKYAAGDTSWTSLFASLTTSLKTRFVVGNGYALLLNGTDNVRSYDGTTVADEGSTNASCPLGTFGIFHQNMFIIGGHLTNKSYFWWSDVLTKTFSRSTNVHKVGDKDNGIMKGMVNFSLTSSHGFLIFKSNGIYFIDSSNSSPANWQKILVDDSHGLAATDTLVAIGASVDKGGDVLYLSNDGASDGNNKFRVRSLIRTINDKIQNSGVVSDGIQTALDELNASQVDKCCAVLFDNKYFLAFPAGSATYNDHVAVLDLTASRPDEGFWAWSIWEGMNVACWAIFEASGVKNLYYGEASGNSVVFKALTGTSDNGAAIEFIERGREEDFDLPELTKAFKWVECVFEQTDNTLVTVKASIDGGGLTTLGTVNVRSNAPSLPVSLPFNLDSTSKTRKKFQLEDLGVGRGIQIQTSHSDLNKRVKFLGYTLLAFPENVEMGDD